MGKRKTRRKVGNVESTLAAKVVSENSVTNVEIKDETKTQGVRRSPRKNRITVTAFYTNEKTNITTRRTRQAKDNDSRPVRSTAAFQRTTRSSGQGKIGASNDPAPSPTPADQQGAKPQTCKRQAKKRSINDINGTRATNNKWSEDSSEKKRKLSDTQGYETIVRTNGKLCNYRDADILRMKGEVSPNIPKEEFEKMKSKYGDVIPSKEDELERLKQELSSCISRNEYDKMKHSMDKELTRLKDELSESVPKKEVESMELEYNTKKHSLEEEILRLKQEVSSCIPRNEYEKMKQRYDDEKLSMDKELTRLKKELTTRISKDEFDRIKLDYEEKTRLKEKELTRVKKETASHVAKEEFEKMKKKYEDDIRSKDEELESLRKELSQRVTDEELEKIRLKYKDKKRSKTEEISRLKQEVSSRIPEEEYFKMKQRYEEEKQSKEEELARLKTEISECIPKKELEEMKLRYKKEKRSNKEEIVRLKQEISSRISKDEFDKMKFDYEEEIRSKDKEQKRLRQEISSRVSKEEYDRIKSEYEEENRLKNEALTRLSAMASSKLRYNNPNIADLSDENRPTKIAEKMSELYDNQWTDAYDALQNEMDEKDIISFLLDILMKTYQECKKIASDSYFEKVQRIIEMPLQENTSQKGESVLPDQLKHLIKEFRKSRAVYVIKDVVEAITSKLHLPHTHLEDVKKYISCCVEISWLMVVQDPPVVLTTETSSKFDTNTYKDYTKRGPFVEYVVWPALLLHEGGPILAKGVAQGCKK